MPRIWSALFKIWGRGKGTKAEYMSPEFELLAVAHNLNPTEAWLACYAVQANKLGVLTYEYTHRNRFR